MDFRTVAATALACLLPMFGHAQGLEIEVHFLREQTEEIATLSNLDSPPRIWPCAAQSWLLTTTRPLAAS